MPVPMPVPVVRVGMVRVVVDHRLVPVRVRVGLHRHSLGMRVMVMLIANVGMVVFNGVVHVSVPVPCPEQDGHAECHDEAGSDLLPGQPFAEDRHRLCLAKTLSTLGPLTILPRALILPVSMLRLLGAFLPTLLSAMRSGRHLVIENLALRQRLVTLTGRRHPDIRPADRVFWVLLRRYWSRWVQVLAIVEPDTVVRWHRAALRTYWNWLSRRGQRSDRPPLPREVRALIRRMAIENPRGAPRIHGELLSLGFDVSERSVSRYLRSSPRTPKANATWTTFLRNHRDGIAALDFFTVPTAMFRVLHVFLVIRHGGRDVVRCAVTTSPTASWVAQQLREAFPFESVPRFMIFDRDAIFSAGLLATIRSMLMEPTRTSH